MRGESPRGAARHQAGRPNRAFESANQNNPPVKAVRHMAIGKKQE